MEKKQTKFFLFLGTANFGTHFAIFKNARFLITKIYYSSVFSAVLETARLKLLSCSSSPNTLKLVFTKIEKTETRLIDCYS